jgi:transcriptional regulator GlxA family with amidase domain
MTRTPTEIVEVVERVVLERLPRRVALRELARAAGVSIADMHLAFRSTLGVPLYRRLLSLRLEAADRLLTADPTLTAEAVALQCGFGHYGVFQRNFKVRFGREPRRRDRTPVGGPRGMVADDAIAEPDDALSST